MGQYIVWLGRVTLVIGVLIGLVSVSLLTTSGQRIAIGLASYIATSEHFKLSIGRLEGSLFDSGRLAHITIGDRKGTWLDVQNIQFAWSALSLLGGHVNVEDIQIESVDVVRKPLLPDKPSSKSSSSSLPLMRVTLKRLQIEQLMLGEALAGTAARFQIKANAKLIDHRQDLSARLTATRLDQPGARVAAELNFRAVTQNLSVQISASEPVGGLVATMMRLPDAPAMSMKFSGQGPLDGWQAGWSVSASEQPFVTGRVRLDRIANRHRLATDFAGYVQHIVPAGIADLMSGKTTGSLIGFFTGLDRFDASHISLVSDTLQLKGGGGFVPASSYAYGTISMRIAGKDERPVTIAVSKDDRVSVRKLNFRATVPDVQTARDISLDVAVEGLTHKLGALLKFELTSRITQSRPVGSGAWAADRVALQVKTDGLSSPVKGLVEAIGALGQLDLIGSLKSGELAIEGLRIGDDTTHLVGSGHLSRNGYAGTAKLTIDDLRRFSRLYGQPIAGRLSIAAKSTVGRGSETSIVTFDGAAKDLALGQGALARLIGNAAEVSGELAHDVSGGVRLRKFDATGANVTVAAHGRYAEAKIEVDHSVEVRDLSALHSGLAGAGKLEARLRGRQHDLASKIQISTQSSSWRGHKVKGLVLNFEGKGPASAHKGLLAVDGSIGRQKLFSKARLTLGVGGIFAAQALELAIGRNKLAGAMRVAPGETPSGNFTLDATQLSDLEVLIGQKVSGALKGSIELSEKQQQPFINANIEAPSVRVGGNSLKGLKGAVVLRNYLAGIHGTASLTLASLRGDGMKARNLSLTMRDSSGRMVFAGTGHVNDAVVKFDGSFKQRGKAFDIVVKQGRLTQGALHVRLDVPAQLTVNDDEVRIHKLRVVAGRGQIEIKGVASAKALNLDAVLSQVPAKIANAFVPSLGLDGSIGGTATVRGTPAGPIATINTSWKNAIARAMRENHLPAVNIKLEGGYRNGTGSVKVNVRGPQGFSLSVVGDAQFKTGKRINLRIQGDAPLALGNAALATRATLLSGRAKISGNVSGTIDKPKVAATINIPNATIHDPSSGLKLKQVIGQLKLTEQGMDIHTFKGKSGLGGTVSLSGTITTGADKSTRVQLNVQLDKMKFNDHHMIAGEVDGKVKLAGPLDALVADGSVYIRRMDVTVPAAAPRSITVLSIKHLNAPGRAPMGGKHTQKPVQGGAPVRVALNLRIDAANRIFIKGRGVDAQLGGGLRVLGSANAPITDGAFNMTRGRLDILGRRLDFRRGRIIFDGALEPVLDMEAVTAADKVTIVVTIAGVASKPSFKFSSNPELPEDEIIARLLFNKALVGLSPLQLVRLASEVDKIGGLSSGPGILDKLKSSVGIDVLDVSTDKTGAATVSAGSYVSDKTYVGVRQGANANSSRVIIDHDFTKNLKARGEVGADGNSKLGIGLEWNY